MDFQVLLRVLFVEGVLIVKPFVHLVRIDSGVGTVFNGDYRVEEVQREMCELATDIYKTNICNFF